jgi:thiol-disulfide isomerase/thioredoxin
MGRSEFVMQISKTLALGLAAALSAGLLTGCPDKGTITPDPEPAAEAAPAADDAQRTEVSVTLQPLDPQNFSTMLAEHRGKVVAIDFWATWCVPCREGFPQTVSWARNYDDGDVIVMSISLDEHENEGAALEFLQEQQAEFPNYISSVGAADAAFEAFDIDGGAVPHFKVFDREGQLFKKFGGDPDMPFDHADVEAAIKAALAK